MNTRFENIDQDALTVLTFSQLKGLTEVITENLVKEVVPALIKKYERKEDWVSGLGNIAKALNISTSTLQNRMDRNFYNGAYTKVNRTTTMNIPKAKEIELKDTMRRNGSLK